MHEHNIVNKGIVLLCVIMVVIAYFYQVFLYWNYTNDDAYITYRYSRFLATGRGPYFNIGEHVEGYTNPLLMFLLAGVFRMTAKETIMPIFAKILGVASGFLCVLLSFFLCRYFLKTLTFSEPLADYWGIASAGIVAICPFYALNSTSGLETLVFSGCLTTAVGIGMLEQNTQRWLGAGFFLGLTLLCRPEGVLLVAVFLVAQGLVLVLQDAARRSSSLVQLPRSLLVLWFSMGGRILLLNSLLVLLIFGAHITFRYVMYDGEFLPNTYYAKSGGWNMGAVQYIIAGLPPALGGIVGIGISGIGFLIRRHLSASIIPLMVIVFTGAGLPLLTGSDWMMGYRLLMPYLPLIAVLTAIGWSFVGQKFIHNSTIVLVLLIIAGTGLWFSQDYLRKMSYQEIILRDFGYQTGHKAVAEWLKTHGIRPGDSIALMDVGIIGYTNIDQHIIDITGLTDRTIAKSAGGFLGKEYDIQYVLQDKPEFIILVLTSPGISYHEPPIGTSFTFWTGVEKNFYMSPDFQRSYRRVKQSLPDNASWLDNLAVQFGAEKIFEHGFPRNYYLLAIFRYNEEP